uniref:Uncharacterized protein n=1 Tax=Chenopodium quinoa TaxID=63459 RepID=A0A803MGW7_CHEQI
MVVWGDGVVSEEEEMVLKDELMRILMGVCSWCRDEEMVDGIALFAVFRVFRKSWVVILISSSALSKVLTTSRYIHPTTFVYPYYIGKNFEPLPTLEDEAPINWDCCVIGRVWDARNFSLSLYQRLVARFWHLRAPVTVFNYVQELIFSCETTEDVDDLEDRVPMNLNLHLAELWVGVVGLPFRYSTPQVAAVVLAHVGDVTNVDESHGQFPVPCPRVKILVDLSLPLIAGCYFPTVHDNGGSVLFGPTDLDLYSDSLRGICPSPDSWHTELWFGVHDDDDPSEYGADSHPSDYGDDGANTHLVSLDTSSDSAGDSTTPRSVASISGLFPPPSPTAFRRAPRVNHADHQHSWQYMGGGNMTLHVSMVWMGEGSVRALSSPSPSLSCDFQTTPTADSGYNADTSSRTFSFSSSVQQAEEPVPLEDITTDEEILNEVVPMECSPPVSKSSPESGSTSAIPSAPWSLVDNTIVRPVAEGARCSCSLIKGKVKMFIRWVKQVGRVCPAKREATDVLPSAPPLPDSKVGDSASGCLPCLLPFKERKGLDGSDSSAGSSVMVFVYGAPHLADRMAFGLPLLILLEITSSTLLIGDFNQVEYISDKVGGSATIPGCLDFIQWRMDLGLIDVPFSGSSYTWTNERIDMDPTFERLDRAYATSDWFLSYPDSLIMHQPILFSDHAAIIFTDTIDRSVIRRPYRIENWCLEAKEVVELISATCLVHFSGSPQFDLSRCLSVIRDKLRSWCLSHRKSWGINWRKFCHDISANSMSLDSPLARCLFITARNEKMEEAQTAYL